MSSLWFKIAIAGVWVGAIVLIAELLHLYTSTDPEKIRKVVHIGTGQVILLAWWLEIPAWVGITASILASVVTLLSYKFPILPGINSVGRKSLGTFFYAASIGILVAWFWAIEQPQYAAIGILVMTWGDGLAALIGQKYGKHPYKIGGIQKSWEGSLTMALVSYLVASLILFAVEGNIWQVYVVPIAVALIATGLEAFSKLGVDNITVPVGSAALCFFLMEILPSSL
ncbi:diacylglycerol/polyprenol kinase family protein [Aerosakkonemataceae cyanobacterium BLCC-F154]|uniref:Diacylglycerol/polyprenol kinase family protein n=1 Tax=Floridaenema fluviatile BLCC-F154 TaxID=3153640 RepID=A0ABV4YFH4_9CYAN